MDRSNGNRHRNNGAIPSVNQTDTLCIDPDGRLYRKWIIQEATNGTLLNWKFSPECLSGETGRDNFIHLVDTYFGQKGMHSQFNIISTETMKDALDHPENYKDMLVRVVGYSAYFVELSRPLQVDLISRTELSFE